MKLPGWLLALFATAFVLYTDDYVIAGILPELADDLGVSEGQAGQLVSVFSVTVAVAAPVGAVTFARISTRRLFVTALLVFIGANIAAASTPSFAALMIFRVAAALAAACSTPALFAFAARNAPQEKVGRFLAIISLGVTDCRGCPHRYLDWWRFRMASNVRRYGHRRWAGTRACSVDVAPR